jgi:hypothetical protein
MSSKHKIVPSKPKTLNFSSPTAALVKIPTSRSIVTLARNKSSSIRVPWILQTKENIETGQTSMK